MTHKILVINKHMLEVVVEFFGIFKNVFDTLEPINSITANLVVPTYFSAMSQLRDFPSKLSTNPSADSDVYDIILVLSDAIYVRIQAKIHPEIRPIHYAATYLDPNFNQFSNIEEIEARNNAFETAKTFIKQKINCFSIPQVFINFIFL